MDRCLYAARLYRPALALLLLSVVTGFVYRPVLSAEAVYEDTNDTRMLARPWAGVVAETREAIRWPFRALARMSHAWALENGTRIDRDHAFSLGVHLLNGLLFAWLLAHVLPAWGIVVTVGLFWLHPLQTESVAYLSARPDLLMTTGLLVALIGVAEEWMAVVWMGAIVAVLAKETGIVIGLLAPAIAVMWKRPWSPAQWSCWGCTGLAASLYLFYQQLVWPHAAFWPHPWLIGQRIVEALAIGSRLVWPFHLSIDHDPAWIDPFVIVPVVLLTLVAAAGLLVGRARWPLLLGMLALSCVLLSPHLLLPLPEGLHEHHFYPVVASLSVPVGAWVTRRSHP